MGRAVRLGWAVVALWAGLSGLLPGVAGASTRPGADPTVDDTVTPDARQLVRWVRASGDHRGRPFAIVDKKNARLFVFGASGRMVGAAGALLGLTPGDHAIAGIGQRALSDIRPWERTTPAGRFASEPGRNLSGEHVVWVDYDAGFAIHRLRPGQARERREARLASPTAHDNRVSLGCVVVTGEFYDAVVAPVLGRGAGVVYVLPETQSVQALFGAPPLTRQAAATASGAM